MCRRRAPTPPGGADNSGENFSGVAPLIFENQESSMTADDVQPFLVLAIIVLSVVALCLYTYPSWPDNNDDDLIY
jgi:hypothetical protein